MDGGRKGALVAVGVSCCRGSPSRGSRASKQTHGHKGCASPPSRLWPESSGRCPHQPEQVSSPRTPGWHTPFSPVRKVVGVGVREGKDTELREGQWHPEVTQQAGALYLGLLRACLSHPGWAPGGGKAESGLAKCLALYGLPSERHFLYTYVSFPQDSGRELTSCISLAPGGKCHAEHKSRRHHWLVADQPQFR